MIKIIKKGRKNKKRKDKKEGDFNTEEEREELELEQEERVLMQVKDNDLSEVNKIEANDDVEVLVPDEHPEETTSLEELEEKLESIIKLLEKKDINEEESKKLLKLKKLYLQQKKIF